MHRIIFHSEFFTLYSYGFFVALAFLLSSLLMILDAKKKGIATNDMFDFLIAIMAGGLIGGRILFVLVNLKYYVNHPSRIFFLNEGGLAFQGALLFAMLLASVVLVVKKLSVWKVADIAAPYVALGQAIGRIGCFLNGCCYGKVIVDGVGVTFPEEAVMRIPVQIYLSLAFLIISIFLLAIRPKIKYEGCTFALYLMLYSLIRGVLDFLRGDINALFYGITLSQAISLGVFLLGGMMCFVLWRKGR